MVMRILLVKTRDFEDPGSVSWSLYDRRLYDESQVPFIRVLVDIRSERQQYHNTFEGRRSDLLIAVALT